MVFYEYFFVFFCENNQKIALFVLWGSKILCWFLKFSYCDILFFHCDFQVMLKRYIIIKFFLLKEVLFIKYYYYYITLFRSNSHNQYVCCMSRKFFLLEWQIRVYFCLYIFERKQSTRFLSENIKNTKLKIWKWSEKRLWHCERPFGCFDFSLFVWQKKTFLVHFYWTRGVCLCIQQMTRIKLERRKQPVCFLWKRFFSIWQVTSHIFLFPALIPHTVDFVAWLTCQSALRSQQTIFPLLWGPIPLLAFRILLNIVIGWLWLLQIDSLLIMLDKV